MMTCGRLPWLQSLHDSGGWVECDQVDNRILSVSSVPFCSFPSVLCSYKIKIPPIGPRGLTCTGIVSPTHSTSPILSIPQSPCSNSITLVRQPSAPIVLSPIITVFPPTPRRPPPLNVEKPAILQRSAQNLDVRHHPQLRTPVLTPRPSDTAPFRPISWFPHVSSSLLRAPSPIWISEASDSPWVASPPERGSPPFVPYPSPSTEILP